MMAYRRFRLSESAPRLATVATFATLQVKKPGTVANVASVAKAPAVSVDLEDWQAYFDERAGIREFDSGLPRSEAELRAFADTVATLGQRPTGDKGHER
jgi:hypothetical protein